MIHVWRLSEVGPDNLGLACTDDGLLLGYTSLIERRGDCFVVRERGEIERLLKRAYRGEPPVDRLMSGLATVASALNANDQCLARIAAVHLEIPDLGSTAARDAMAAEDALIKYARDEATDDANWNPALHPRTGAPPNPGWFAPTGGEHDSAAVRVAENQTDSHRTDALPASDDKRITPPPDYQIGKPASFDHVSGSKDRPSAIGSRSRCLNMISKAAGLWENGHDGASSHLTSAFPPRARRFSAVRRSACRRSCRLWASAEIRLKPRWGPQEEQVR